MCCQEIYRISYFVQVYLGTQVLIVKVRYRLDIVNSIKVQEIYTVLKIHITLQCLAHTALTVPNDKAINTKLSYSTITDRLL